MNLGQPAFAGIENKDKERALNEIVSLNDNGDYLIHLLNLGELKAKPNGAKNEDTILRNTSGTLDHEKRGDGLLRDIVLGLKDFSYKKYPLIDLGTNGQSYISIFAQHIGVPGVVAADMQLQIKPSSLKSLKESQEYKNKNFPVLGLKIDMLELLQQLPDNSCNISLFAIDQTVIISEEYQQKLVEQLHRVVPSDGLLLSSNSIMRFVATRGYWEKLYADILVQVFKKIEKSTTT